jgi:hypothetical protein
MPLGTQVVGLYEVLRWPLIAAVFAYVVLRPPSALQRRNPLLRIALVGSVLGLLIIAFGFRIAGLSIAFVSIACMLAAAVYNPGARPKG